MQTGQFINTVEKGRERFYTSDDAEQLLSKGNYVKVWNHINDGPGEYPDFFPEDMAIVHTKVSVHQEEDGRIFYRNDTVITKFDFSDAPLILNVLNEKMNLLNRMETTHKNNGEQLRNPLPKPEWG